MNKSTSIFIDTQDMEEMYGEQLYQEYLENENNSLKEKVNQLEINIDETIEYIKNHIHQETYTGYMDAKELMKLVFLLERGKDEKRRNI